MDLSSISILVPVLRFLDDLLQRVRKPRLVANVYTTIKPDPHNSSQEMWALVFEVINGGEKPIVITDQLILVEESTFSFGKMYGTVSPVPYNLQPGEIWSVWMPARQAGENLLIEKLPANAKMKVRFTDVHRRKYESESCVSTIGELAEYPLWNTD